MTTGVMTETEYGVKVNIPRPAKTSRLLLLFRFILAIPHYVFALAVGLVASILVLINYLVVLITGHAAFVGFLSGTLRYMTRLTAYLYFLTDKYPPFSLGEAPDYPVQVLVRPPGKIHRWRIFSYILAFPHMLLLYGLLIVVSVTTLIAWVAGLIIGRYLPGLFGIAAGAVAYQARLNGYLYLITDSYPPFSILAD